MYTPQVEKAIENYRWWKRLEHTLYNVTLALAGGALGAALMLRFFIKFQGVTAFVGF